MKITFNTGGRGCQLGRRETGSEQGRGPRARDHRPAIEGRRWAGVRVAELPFAPHGIRIRLRSPFYAGFCPARLDDRRWSGIVSVVLQGVSLEPTLRATQSRWEDDGASMRRDVPVAKILRRPSALIPDDLAEAVLFLQAGARAACSIVSTVGCRFSVAMASWSGRYSRCSSASFVVRAVQLPWAVDLLVRAATAPTRRRRRVLPAPDLVVALAGAPNLFNTPVRPHGHRAA